MEKLYRSRDSKLGGVCSGLSKYLNIDESFVKIAFALLIFSPMPIITTYLILWIIIPKEPIN
jgi:phage shock protein PspC (stress-responsive transcriptional regulator)